MARILVIDDDSQIRTMLRRALERAGHVVADAADGAGGLQQFAADPADLVITDIFMPGQDGIETIRALRRTDAAVKIICITGADGSGMLDLGEHAVLLGAVSTLRKPFELTDLIKTVAQALQPDA